jgi:dienelactone hydrolase
MQEFETFGCDHAGFALEGLVARPQGDGPFPTVIVMHSANGLRHQVQGSAQRLAQHGYLAVATDMYGPEVQAIGHPAAGEAYMNFHENPALLRERVVTWYNAIAARPDVDASRIAAIGYCFGGWCVLELARSGVDVKAVVSYHGILTTHAPARKGEVKCEVAAYCGALDPYAPMDTVDALREELTAAEVRYNISVFGAAAHSFTDPDAASMGMPGIEYNAIANRVSWAGTLALLEDVLGS